MADGQGRRCVIVTARYEGAWTYERATGDMVLCADGGWRIAQAYGLAPDLVIGDFDSSARPEGMETIVHPIRKDDTDAMLCARYGLENGCADFLLLGGFGGRLDHTLANLQTLAYLKAHGARDARMRDGLREAVVLREEVIALPRRPGHLSLFAMGDRCECVSVSGAEYDLQDGALTNCFPLGVSNAFREDVVRLSVRRGLLLVLTDETE
ncbi:MAG: thiamine diphosphokinase [Clostridia bacterium]|nr:thiamine diphosphokinase [Clostridia bacterium]